MISADIVVFCFYGSICMALFSVGAQLVTTDKYLIASFGVSLLIGAVYLLTPAHDWIPLFGASAAVNQDFWTAGEWFIGWCCGVLIMMGVRAVDA